VARYLVAGLAYTRPGVVLAAVLLLQHVYFTGRDPAALAAAVLLPITYACATAGERLSVTLHPHPHPEAGVAVGVLIAPPQGKVMSVVRAAPTLAVWFAVGARFRVPVGVGLRAATCAALPAAHWAGWWYDRRAVHRAYADLRLQMLQHAHDRLPLDGDVVAEAERVVLAGAIRDMRRERWP